MKGLTQEKLDELIKALVDCEPFPVWHGVRCGIADPKIKAWLLMEIRRRKMPEDEAQRAMLHLTGQGLAMQSFLMARKEQARKGGKA